MQSKNRSIIIRLTAAMAAAMSLGAFTGCGVSNSRPPSNYTAPFELAGLALSGRNFLSNATIKVYATQPNGVATNGTYVGKAKLLGTTHTSVTGTWTLDSVTCDSPDQVYVTAEGGIPFPFLNNFTSLTNNPNILMMTAIGDCSQITNPGNPRNVTQVITNEASSVAAVWALRPFMSISGTTVNIASDATNYAGTSGAGVIGNYAGLVHAFENANNLTPFRQGAFASFTNGADSVATGGAPAVQQLNALAYIQYLCTMGAPDGATAGNFSLCTGDTTATPGLYTLTTPAGGTAPTNSLQAMLNIANNPQLNAQALMAFAQTNIPGAPTGQQNYGPVSHGSIGPFTPALTSFCSTTCPVQDWTVSVTYGPGFGGNGSTIQPTAFPMYLSLDANDNVFFSNPNAGTSTAGNIISMSSNGTYRWGSLTDPIINDQPRANAIDQFGNLWVASGDTGPGQNVIQQYNSSTGALLNSYAASNVSLYGIAVDTLGNVWYTDNIATGQNLHELVKSQSYAEATFPIPPASGFQMLQVRPDSKNNIWVAGYVSGGGGFQYFPNTGTAAAPTYTAGLVSFPLSPTAGYGVGLDALGNAYMTTAAPGAGGAGTLYYATVNNPGAGATLSAANVAAVPSYNTATFGGTFMDTDGAGTLWFSDRSSTTYFYSYVPSTQVLSTFYPCYGGATNTGGTGSPGPGVNYCSGSASTRFDQALDSTGSLWVASYNNGRIIQVISPAAPTIPLKALGKIGVMP